jgi:hypothetical protein
MAMISATSPARINVPHWKRVSLVQMNRCTGSICHFAAVSQIR